MVVGWLIVCWGAAYLCVLTTGLVALETSLSKLSFEGFFFFNFFSLILTSGLNIEVESLGCVAGGELWYTTS